jgi:DNA-binding PadR family transcriptional regulator
MFGVIRSIRHLGLQASGTGIRDLLARQTGEEIESARVYVALLRLERKGLVSATDETERPAGRRGRPRRIYALTATGLRALEAGLKLYVHPMPRKSGVLDAHGVIAKGEAT